MARGPKPQSTALKILRGNPGKRKLNLEEPQYELGAPEKPAWLEVHASAEWDRLCSVMLAGQLLTVADAGVLLSCCLAYSQMVRNELLLQKLGDTYEIEDPWGGKIPKTRPEMVRAEVARRQYVSFLADMGQTTVSKSKVKKITPSQAGGVKRLLG